MIMLYPGTARVGSARVRAELPREPVYSPFLARLRDKLRRRKTRRVRRPPDSTGVFVQREPELPPAPPPRPAPIEPRKKKPDDK